MSEERPYPPINGGKRTAAEALEGPPGKKEKQETEDDQIPSTSTQPTRKAKRLAKEKQRGKLRQLLRFKKELEVKLQKLEEREIEDDEAKEEKLYQCECKVREALLAQNEALLTLGYYDQNETLEEESIDIDVHTGDGHLDKLLSERLTRDISSPKSCVEMYTQEVVDAIIAYARSMDPESKIPASDSSQYGSYSLTITDKVLTAFRNARAMRMLNMINSNYDVDNVIVVEDVQKATSTSCQPIYAKFLEEVRKLKPETEPEGEECTVDEKDEDEEKEEDGGGEELTEENGKMKGNEEEIENEEKEAGEGQIEEKRKMEGNEEKIEDEEKDAGEGQTNEKGKKEVNEEKVEDEEKKEENGQMNGTMMERNEQEANGGEGTENEKIEEVEEVKSEDQDEEDIDMDDMDLPSIEDNDEDLEETTDDGSSSEDGSEYVIRDQNAKEDKENDRMEQVEENDAQNEVTAVGNEPAASTSGSSDDSIQVVKVVDLRPAKNTVRHEQNDLGSLDGEDEEFSENEDDDVGEKPSSVGQSDDESNNRPAPEDIVELDSDSEGKRRNEAIDYDHDWLASVANMSADEKQEYIEQWADKCRLFLEQQCADDDDADAVPSPQCSAPAALRPPSADARKRAACAPETRHVHVGMVEDVIVLD